MNTMKEKSNKNPLLKSFIHVIVGVIISMTSMTACKSPETPVQLNQLERLAKSINYKCPFMVDSDTRMDSVHFPADSTFQYDYTLVKVDQEKVDVSGLTAYIGSVLLETVQTSSTMKVHRDHQLTMVFYYRDRKGDFVTQIIIKPEDYSSLQ